MARPEAQPVFALHVGQLGEFLEDQRACCEASMPGPLSSTWISIAPGRRRRAHHDARLRRVAQRVAQQVVQDAPQQFGVTVDPRLRDAHPQRAAALAGLLGVLVAQIGKQLAEGQRPAPCRHQAGVEPRHMQQPVEQSAHAVERAVSGGG